MGVEQELRAESKTLGWRGLLKPHGLPMSHVLHKDTLLILFSHLPMTMGADPFHTTTVPVKTDQGEHSVTNVLAA